MPYPFGIKGTDAFKLSKCAKKSLEPISSNEAKSEYRKLAESSLNQQPEGVVKSGMFSEHVIW
jgi:hypothetical protein